jgi:hypothetical protein
VAAAALALAAVFVRADSRARARQTRFSRRGRLRGDGLRDRRPHRLFGGTHTFRVKKAMYRRDDIWIVTPQGSKRRLIDGEKFVRGTAPFSYVVDSLTRGRSMENSSQSNSPPID